MSLCVNATAVKVLSCVNRVLYLSALSDSSIGFHNDGLAELFGLLTRLWRCDCLAKGEIESLLRMKNRCRRSVINIETASTDTMHLLWIQIVSVSVSGLVDGRSCFQSVFSHTEFTISNDNISLLSVNYYYHAITKMKSLWQTFAE